MLHPYAQYLAVLDSSTNRLGSITRIAHMSNTCLLARTVYDLIIDASKDLPEARASGVRDEEVRSGIRIHAVDLGVDDVRLTSV